ncbi:MAG: hypothetical protein IKA64_07315 [Clostridia bacterium]|nr:hypothetical protein [Clostridia bacterium]
MSYFLAVDLGTTGCRSIIFDGGLNILASSYSEYALITPREMWVEQSSLDWWELTLRTAGEAIGLSGISPSEIKSIAISSQGITVVPVDENINPLCNALTWLDTRATAEAERISRDFGERIYKITGKEAKPDYTLPKLLWLREHEPEIFGRAYKFLLPSDFLVARLVGGRCVTDRSMASGTLMYDLARGEWSAEILEKYQIDIAKLPEVADATAPAGRVCPEVAQRLGLSPDCMVAVGAQDQKCAAYGVGLDMGIMTVSLGTAAAVTKLWREPLTDINAGVGWCGYVRPDRFVTEGVIDTAATCLRWVRDIMFGGCGYDVISAEAEAARERGSSLVFTPYLAGPSDPDAYPASTGVFHGVTLATRRGDFALAVMEGVAFGLRRILEAMEAYGSVESLILFGGGAKSDIWCKIIADVTGLRILVPTTSEAAGAGAARIAAHAVGERLSPLGFERCYEPSERSAEYAEKYKKYIELEKRLFVTEG